MNKISNSYSFLSGSPPTSALSSSSVLPSCFPLAAPTPASPAFQTTLVPAVTSTAICPTFAPAVLVWSTSSFAWEPWSCSAILLALSPIVLPTSLIPCPTPFAAISVASIVWSNVSRGSDFSSAGATGAVSSAAVGCDVEPLPPVLRKPVFSPTQAPALYAALDIMLPISDVTFAAFAVPVSAPPTTFLVASENSVSSSAGGLESFRSVVLRASLDERLEAASRIVLAKLLIYLRN